MATISEALNLFDEKKNNLRKAFDELKSHSSYLSTFTLTWSDIESHFSAQHSTLVRKLNLLKSQPSDPKTQTQIESAPSVVKAFCEAMDGLGLRNYIANQKPKARLVIGDELQDAFRYAPNAAAMVLDALEGYFVPNSKGDKACDASLGNLRKACITMLEAMTKYKVEVSPEVRERAKSLALDWKEKVNVDGSSTFEPYGFLCIVANYGLVDVFSMDDLIDMSVLATKFGQVVRLFRVLCFGDKMPDLIKKIISKGKQLQAVKYILEFKLADKFPPVPLLEECVDEVKKNAQKTREDGKNSLRSLNEATTKEVNTLISVVNILKDFKLEAEPLKQSLMKRIQVLEKEKANRKKRPRDTTHAQIPKNYFTSTSAANNHQATVPHVATTNPIVTPFQQSYSAAPSFATTQSHTYNASSGAQAYQQSYQQFVPGADVATTTSLTVPPYQQSYVQHTSGGQATTPNVASASEAVSAYRKSYQPHGSYGSEAEPHGLAGSNTVASYASSSAGGLYGSAGASLGIAGNSTHAQSHVYATEPNTASGYYDRSVNYGGYAVPPQYHPSYHPQ